MAGDARGGSGTPAASATDGIGGASRGWRKRRGRPGVEEEGRASRGRSVRLGRGRGAGGAGFGGGGGMLLYEGGSG
jgi:hypothetical protein